MCTCSPQSHCLKFPPRVFAITETQHWILTGHGTRYPLKTPVELILIWWKIFVPLIFVIRIKIEESSGSKPPRVSVWWKFLYSSSLQLGSRDLWPTWARGLEAGVVGKRNYPMLMILVSNGGRRCTDISTELRELDTTHLGIQPDFNIYNACRCPNSFEYYPNYLLLQKYFKRWCWWSWKFIKLARLMGDFPGSRWRRPTW